MRAIVLLAMTACGAGGGLPPSNARVAEPPVPRSVKQPIVEQVEPSEPCTSRVESWPPGHHDRYAFEDPVTSLYGFKDGKGNIVVAPQFRFAYEFGPGGIAAAVDANAKFVFIAPSGVALADAYPYDNGPDYFQEGFARIVDANKKVGFISERGDIIIAPQYDAAAGFCHGVAEVELGTQTFHVDRHNLRASAPPAAP